MRIPPRAQGVCACSPDTKPCMLRACVRASPTPPSGRASNIVTCLYTGPVVSVRAPLIRKRPRSCAVPPSPILSSTPPASGFVLVFVMLRTSCLPGPEARPGRDPRHLLTHRGWLTHTPWLVGDHPNAGQTHTPRLVNSHTVAGQLTHRGWLTHTPWLVFARFGRPHDTSGPSPQA